MSLNVMEMAATSADRGQERFEAAMTSKNQITLPAKLCLRLGLTRGDRVELLLESDGTVRMIPQRAVPDLQQFVGIWRGQGLLGEVGGDGNAYVEELRGPIEPEA